MLEIQKKDDTYTTVLQNGKYTLTKGLIVNYYSFLVQLSLSNSSAIKLETWFACPPVLCLAPKYYFKCYSGYVSRLGGKT